jgi:hypothetical protein
MEATPPRSAARPCEPLADSEGLDRSSSNPRQGSGESEKNLGDEAEEVVGGDGVGGGERSHGGSGDRRGDLSEVLAAEVRHDEGVHLPQQLRLLHRLVHSFPSFRSSPLMRTVTAARSATGESS